MVYYSKWRLGGTCVTFVGFLDACLLVFVRTSFSRDSTLKSNGFLV